VQQVAEGRNILPVKLVIHYPRALKSKALPIALLLQIRNFAHVGAPPVTLCNTFLLHILSLAHVSPPPSSFMTGVDMMNSLCH